jgi:hypothetical protein
MQLCEIEFMSNGKFEIYKCVYHSMELQSEIGSSQESGDLAPGPHLPGPSFDSMEHSYETYFHSVIKREMAGRLTSQDRVDKT